MTNFIKLFNRIPDDVVLRVSSRNMRMGDGLTCLCGWSIREALAGLTGRSADGIGMNDFDGLVTEECAKMFGGSQWDWCDVYFGVVDPYDRLPKIETAWVDRLDKAVRRAR